MHHALSRRLIASVLLLACTLGSTAHAAEKKQFNFAWSIYAGFMPWLYAEQSGILKKWADKYGIEIKLTQFNDYIESINQYTAGQFDGVVATNMDALSIPGAGGVDTTVLIVGDYSNGSDEVVLKGKGLKLADIKGKEVHLVQLSVSHYLLSRALSSAGMKESDISTVNISDADFVAAWKTADTKAVVAWKPGLSDIQASPDASPVFNSSQIPGEIMDIAMVNSQTLRDNPAFGKALVGAWYETLAVMQGDAEAAKAARTVMAEASGTDLAGYDTQLATTHLFYKPADAVSFVKNEQSKKIMELVRDFCFEHGLLGEGVKDRNAIGIEFTDGSVAGNKDNVKVRFDATYMGMAADGKL